MTAPVSKPSLRLYAPNPKGGGFIGQIGDAVQRYYRSIRDRGGMWLGGLQLVAPLSDLLWWFNNMLFAEIKEYTAGGSTWEGYISQMDLTTGGIIRRLNIDNMANAIKGVYIDEFDRSITSSFSVDQVSIDHYGRMEEILTRDGYDATAVQAEIDRALKQFAWPRQEPIGSISREGTTLDISLSGWIHTAQNKYVTTLAELDTNQGTLSYLTGPARIQDTGQDFSDWEAPDAEAKWSIRITNTDGTFTAAWLGAASGSNQIVAAYQDKALTTAGWNETSPTGKTPDTYFIMGPVSDYIADIITNDCAYLSTGRIEENRLQVKRALGVPIKAYDLLMDLLDLGDADGNAYRLRCERGRRVHYELIDTTPVYNFQDGQIVEGWGVSANILDPWSVQPQVVRDTGYPVKHKLNAQFLDRANDIYMEKVEVSQLSGLKWSTASYAEADFINRQHDYELWLEQEGERMVREERAARRAKRGQQK